MIHAAAGQLSRPFCRGSVESAWRDLEHPPKFASSRPMPRDRHGGFTTDNVPHVTVSPLVDFTWEWLELSWMSRGEDATSPPTVMTNTRLVRLLGACDIRQKRMPPEGRCERPSPFLAPVPARLEDEQLSGANEGSAGPPRWAILGPDVQGRLPDLVVAAV